MVLICISVQMFPIFTFQRDKNIINYGLKGLVCLKR